MAVQHDVQEVIQENPVAVIDVLANRLNDLQNCKKSCKEEVACIESAMTLQAEVFDGLFKCGAQAFGAHKRKKKELQKVKDGGCPSHAAIPDLTANESMCATNVRQIAEWCKTSTKAMALLETRLNLEVEVAKGVDI
jgi:hypothetical protein